jgi:2'-hydroxyisoflavone reductase
MKVLVFGGTRFLGRHLVNTLCAAGHEVTLLNRGRSDPALYPALERLRGDRDPRAADAANASHAANAADAGASQPPTANALAQLQGRSWDIVFDLTGYVPRVVRAACDALAGRVGRYVFVSSISVYESSATPGQDESAPVARLADPCSEDVMAHYGALKAACEREVETVFGAQALLVRPGLIVGPFDPTGRFTYWPLRIARGGNVLAPAPASYPVQVIDARDLARWMVDAAMAGASGAFNVTGPASPASAAPATLERVLDDCKAVTSADARVHWLDADFLLAEGVAPWMDLPLWVGPDDAAMNQVSVARAVATGLVTRPLRETIADTLAWTGSADYRSPVGPYAKVGLPPDREAELLALWVNRANKTSPAS